MPGAGAASGPGTGLPRGIEVTPWGRRKEGDRKVKSFTGTSHVVCYSLVVHRRAVEEDWMRQVNSWIRGISIGGIGGGGLEGLGVAAWLTGEGMEGLVASEWEVMD